MRSDKSLSWQRLVGREVARANWTWKKMLDEVLKSSERFKLLIRAVFWGFFGGIVVSAGKIDGNLWAFKCKWA